MTIRNLIKALSEYPLDSEIVFGDFDEGLEKQIKYIGIIGENKIYISEQPDYFKDYNNPPKEIKEDE